MLTHAGEESHAQLHRGGDGPLETGDDVVLRCRGSAIIWEWLSSSGRWDAGARLGSTLRLPTSRHRNPPRPLRHVTFQTLVTREPLAACLSRLLALTGKQATPCREKNLTCAPTATIGRDWV